MLGEILYNNSLHIKLEINEIKKRSTQKLPHFLLKKNRIQSTEIKSFESVDTLEPVRYLSSLHDNKTADEPLEQKKIKLQVTYATGIIPVILDYNPKCY